MRPRCRAFFFFLGCKVHVACLFLFRGVGGSDQWFGTSVEDTVELPRSQGSLPVKPEALKNSQCRFLSLTNVHRRGVFFIPRKCSPAHISTHRTVSHHRLRSTQIPQNEGIVLVFVFFCPFLCTVHMCFCCSPIEYLCESIINVGAIIRKVLVCRWSRGREEAKGGSRALL